MANQERMQSVLASNPTVGRKKLSKEAGVSLAMAQRFLQGERGKQPAPVKKNYDPPSNISVEYASDKASIVTSSVKITTLEEALTAAKVNTELWEVDRHVVNWWDVTFKTPDGSETKTNFQIKVWLKPRVRKLVYEALQSLRSDLEGRGPVAPKPKTDNIDRHMLEISIFDLHFGKLAWAAETGTDYDIKIAEQLFHSAIADLLNKAQNFGIEKVLFPIGSDFLHVNSPTNTTVNNTPQDVDSRLVKIFKTACRVVIEAIDACAKIAPVSVVFVPGNHDKDTSFYLCSYLEAWYNRHEGVNVDVSPTARKYVRYGVNLIGFTHGNEEKTASLPLIMAGERATDWGQVSHREWHIGHLHTKKETQFVVGDSHGPVVVRILPSLSGTDAWHYAKGYVCGNRAAESYLWNYENGYVGHFSANIHS